MTFEQQYTCTTVAFNKNDIQTLINIPPEFSIVHSCQIVGRLSTDIGQNHANGDASIKVVTGVL